MGNVEKLVTDWLIEEGYEVKKLPQTPQVKFSWGLDVFTPPPLRVNIKVFKPEERKDRFILLLGVGISPEHQTALNRLSREGRLKFSSKLLSRLIQACVTCSIAIQPNPIEPQGISVALTVFDSELSKDSKPRFMEGMAKMINAFLLIVSTFNEEFPVIPSEGKGSTATRM